MPQVGGEFDSNNAPYKDQTSNDGEYRLSDMMEIDAEILNIQLVPTINENISGGQGQGRHRQDL